MADVIINKGFEIGAGQAATGWTYSEVGTFDFGSGKSRRGDFSTWLGLGPPLQTGNFGFVLGAANTVAFDHSAKVANVSNCQIVQPVNANLLENFTVDLRWGETVAGIDKYKFEILIDTDVKFTMVDTTPVKYREGLLIDLSPYSGTVNLIYRLTALVTEDNFAPAIFIDNMIENLRAAQTVPESALQEKTNHCDEMVANLLEQFKGLPIPPGKSYSKMEALIHALCPQIQEVEAVAFDLLEDRWLNTAVGVQLDGLGQIIGLHRGGLDDEDYRVRLKAQILLNKSSGTGQEIIDILKLILPDNQILLEEYFPAAFIVKALGAIPNTIDGSKIADIVHSAKGAGIQGLFQWGIEEPFFAFDGVNGTGFEEGKFTTAL